MKGSAFLPLWVLQILDIFLDIGRFSVPELVRLMLLSLSLDYHEKWMADILHANFRIVLSIGTFHATPAGSPDY